MINLTSYIVERYYSAVNLIKNTLRLFEKEEEKFEVSQSISNTINIL